MLVAAQQGSWLCSVIEERNEERKREAGCQHQLVVIDSFGPLNDHSATRLFPKQGAVLFRLFV